jgi:hypothetical protein
MGDDAGVGLISALLGGVLRGAQAAKPFIQSGVTKGIRFADPRRLAPLVQQIQKGPLFQPIPVIEKTIQKTPIIKNMPEWARGLVGINTSPAGIGGSVAAGILLDKIINQMQPKAAVASQQPQINPAAQTPAPTPGPRVDASTTQMIDIGAPTPRQAPQVTPVTPTAPPTPVISQAAYNAAITGTQAPGNIPLSEFYAAQRSIGQYAEQGGELQRRLKEAGGAAGMTDEALMAWAQRNPDLALRELMKREKRTGMSVD